MRTSFIAGPALGVLGLSVGLSACTPRTSVPEPTVQSNTAFNSISFYPREAGLSWSYLPENDPVSAVPYVLRALGPTVYAGQAALSYQLTGRGAEQTWFRTVAPDGVRLLGLRKPGVNVYLDPPWLEYPAEAAWKLGLAWQGQSRVTISADDGQVQAQGVLNYSYVVQEQRRVQTPGGAFEVWVVTRQMSDTVGGLFPATQQLWFAPYTGEIRTPEGLLMTGRNFSSRAGARP